MDETERAENPELPYERRDRRRLSVQRSMPKKPDVLRRAPVVGGAVQPSHGLGVDAAETGVEGHVRIGPPATTFVDADLGSRPVPGDLPRVRHVRALDAQEADRPADLDREQRPPAVGREGPADVEIGRPPDRRRLRGASGLVRLHRGERRGPASLRVAVLPASGRHARAEQHGHAPSPGSSHASMVPGWGPRLDERELNGSAGVRTRDDRAGWWRCAIPPRRSGVAAAPS